MQVIMYVMAKAKETSLRERIVQDIDKWDRGDELEIVAKQSYYRPKGWAKIKKAGAAGALNLEWDGDAKTLIVRAVTRAGNKPATLIGSFIAYLLRVHGKRINSITMRTLG